MSYETFFQARLPRWLRGKWSDRLTTVVGGMMDALVVASKDAANQAFVEHCADDAVPYHLRERLLEPLDGETIAAQRLRAQGAWDFWSTLAPTSALRDAIRLYTGLADLEIYSFSGDNTSAAWSDGWVPGLDDDGDGDNWSRHTIVIPQTHPWARPVVGPGLIVGPGLMVGLTMTLNELQRIRRVYRKHRPAHMVGMLIHVLLDATTAADYVLDHSFTSDVVKIPLHVMEVGYPATGAVVGQPMIVGYVHS